MKLESSRNECEHVIDGSVALELILSRFLV